VPTHPHPLSPDGDEGRKGPGFRLATASGGRSWDGETVIRTLADRTRTFHFAGSQASADSSFHLTQRRKGAKMKCWESDHFVLTLRLCAFA